MEDFKQIMSSEGRIEELRLERSYWATLAKDKRLAQAHEMADKMSKQDRSDPFVYNRVYSSLMGNFTTPGDYRKQLSKR